MHALHKIKYWALACVLICTSTAQAHVDWTRVNDADPRVVGLYHFDDTANSPGNLLRADSCWPSDRHLVIGTPTGTGLIMVNDTPEPIFNPYALHLRSPQINDSPINIPDLGGDLTIEFWFKWDAALTSSSLEVGLRSGAKLHITRHVGTPANDLFGISGTHGDYRSAPGFVNWPTVGIDEAPLGEWMHIAVAIHSTGITYDASPGVLHDVYNPGTIARIYLNGHPVGSSPHTLDLSGFKVHANSRLRINNLAGAIKVDEVTIWAHDWSANGTAVNPFGNGRGSGNCVPTWTRTNSSDPKLFGHFQFDGTTTLPGELIENNPCLDVPLVIGAVSGGLGITRPNDTPSAIFNPRSMKFDGAQDNSSTITLQNTGGHLVVEAWVKWDNAVTTSSVEFGMRSGPALRLSRDTVNPANDQFGIASPHGDYIEAPGFIDWPTVGDAAAAIGVWNHVAVSLHSTGIEYDGLVKLHDVYTAGSYAIFWVNGRPIGSSLWKLDIAGLNTHDTSRLRIRNVSGSGVSLDEVTIWNDDLTNEGALLTVFNDGRGNGLCNAVELEWMLYE